MRKRILYVLMSVGLLGFTFTTSCSTGPEIAEPDTRSFEVMDPIFPVTTSAELVTETIFSKFGSEIYTNDIKIKWAIGTVIGGVARRDTEAQIKVTKYSMETRYGYYPETTLTTVSSETQWYTRENSTDLIPLGNTDRFVDSEGGYHTYYVVELLQVRQNQ